MYPQPDDFGDNRVTSTVEYFAKEWASTGNNVMVFHCSSKFPLLLYLIPRAIKNKYAYITSTIIPSVQSRKRINRKDGDINIVRLPMFKPLPGKGF